MGIRSQIAAIAVGVGLTLGASANVVNFEDQYPGYDTAQPLDAGYAGFDWAGDPYSVTNGLLPGSGFEFGTMDSVSLAVFDDGVAFSRPELFNFDRASVAAAWNIDESVLVQGWRQGELLYSRNVLASYNAPALVDFAFNGVDTVTVHGSGGTDAGLEGGGGQQLVLDNLEYSFPQAGPVALPEPTALWLIGAGLILLGLARRSH